MITKNLLRGCGLACALGLASIVFGVGNTPPPPATQETPAAVAGSKTKVTHPWLATTPVGVPNFGVVAPGIYRGAAPTEQGLKTLKAMHIQTIIDLRSAKAAHEEQQRATALGFTSINLPMGSDPPTPAQVATLLATLAKAPTNRVYVHCQYGADRTGCMIGIYRVAVQGWTFARAWQEMRYYGFKPRYTLLTDAVKSRVKPQRPPGVAHSKQ